MHLFPAWGKMLWAFRVKNNSAWGEIFPVNPQRTSDDTYWVDTTCAVHIEDCNGWWLSGCCGSVAEHWWLKPEVSWVRLPVAAGFFTFLYFHLITYLNSLHLTLWLHSFYQRFILHSTWLYYGSTSLYYQFPRLYFTILGSTSLYLTPLQSTKAYFILFDSTSIILSRLYFTLLDSTSFCRGYTLYHGVTPLYLTLSYYYGSTSLYHGSTWFYHGSTSL